MNITTTPCPIGVVGYGHFGEVIARYLSPRHALKIFDSKLKKKKRLQARGLWASLEEVAQQRVVILAIPPVPMRKFIDLLQDLAPHLAPGTLVVDVCSNKWMPIQLMLKYLPSHVEIIGTHPLFGQNSAANGVEGLTIVACKVRAQEPTWQKMLSFFHHFWLRVKITDPHNHDRIMALIQALTHFICRVMEQCHFRRSPYATRPYRLLYGAKEIVCSDTIPLFHTTQLGNPFAAPERERHIRIGREVLRQIKQEVKQGRPLVSSREVTPTEGFSYFMAWVLCRTGIERSAYSTRTYDYLLDLKEIVRGASWKRFVATQVSEEVLALVEYYLDEAEALHRKLCRLEKAEMERLPKGLDLKPSLAEKPDLGWTTVIPSMGHRKKETVSGRHSI